MSTTDVLVKDDWAETTNRAIRDRKQVLCNCQNQCERIENMIAQTLAAARENTAALERRGAEAISDLNNNYAHFVAQLTDMSQTERDRISREFSDTFSAIRADVRNIDNRVSDMSSRVTELGNMFARVFNDFVARENNQRERAGLIREEFNTLMSRVESLSPERFLPEEYSRLTALRAFINSNFDAGDYEAVVARSQSSILEAASTLARLTLMNERYVSALNTATESVLSLRREAELLGAKDNTLQIPVGDTIEEFDYDIHRWAEDDYNEVLSEIGNLESVVGDSNATIEALEKIPDICAVLNNRLSDCDRIAQEAIVDSAANIRLAQNIAQRLVDDRWTIDCSQFANNDEKQPINISASNNDCQIAIVVSNGAAVGDAVFRIEAFSEDHDAAREADIKAGVHASILQNTALTEEDVYIHDDCHLNTDVDTFFENMNSTN